MEKDRPNTEPKPEHAAFFRAARVAGSFGLVWDATMALIAICFLVTYFVTLDLKYLIFAISLAFAAFLSWQAHKSL